MTSLDHPADVAPYGSPESSDLAARSDAPSSPSSEERTSGFGAGVAESESAGAGRKRARRRGSRGGRRRRASLKTASEAPAAAPPRADGDSAEEERPRRSRRRGKKRSHKTPAKASEADLREPGGVSDEPAEVAERAREDGARDGAAARDEPAEDEAARKRRRRGSRGGRRRRKGAGSAVAIEAIPGEDDELGPIEGEERPGRREEREGAGGERKKKRSRSRPAATTAASSVERDQTILVNADGPEETRVAVVQDARIVDLAMTVGRHKSFVGDVYRGRIVNIEPAIDAAFVDFGQGRNGFLHASDVMDVYSEKGRSLGELVGARADDAEWSEDPEVALGDEPAAVDEKDAARAKPRPRGARRGRKRRPISELLRKGQLCVVQITKDAIGDKGPTLTTYISIPGRYLVLMPSLSRNGVSRKVDDEKERRRLKKIVQSIEVPDGMGVIVRTAGVGRTKSELKRDLDYLLAAWDTFKKKLDRGTNPTSLYQESDVAIRTMRDLYTDRTKEVVVDTQHVFEHVVDFAKELMPDQVDRIRVHDGARPLFHAHGVEQDFERLFARRVELPSGGSIVFDQAEALVAIDVNSGRTREDGAGFEDIALKTNLEAAPEIARQMRLRDLGGIIVLDFIDMLRAGNRRAVEKAFRDALKTDRARSKIGRISQFGLLELTRQRLGPGLGKLVYDTCPACRGTGRERTAASRAQAILRRLGSAMTLKGFSTIEVRARPDAIEHLQKYFSTPLLRLQERHKRELRYQTVPDQLEDGVLRYLRADGREVRPGGRRKR